MTDPRTFLFTVCQVGAEPALKKEISRDHPELRFAYSRPGFVTFKSSERSGEPKAVVPEFVLKSVFARAYGVSLGKTASVAEVIAAARALKEETGRKLRLHVWERDEHAPGEEPLGYEPGAHAAKLLSEIRHDPAAEDLFENEETARAGDRVFDVIWIDDGAFWTGFHDHLWSHSVFPGGRAPIHVPADSPSRAYMKLEEAIAWSGAPLKKGDIAVEIGSSPGGASLALLNRGLRVVGIDPAEMNPVVLNHPDFRHFQKPVAEVAREDLPAQIDWLLLDMNVSPQISLFAVDRLASRMTDTLLGVLLTVKLNQWKMADQIPEWLEHVKAMGMIRARATQLAGNRQEIFIYGLTRKGSVRQKS